MKIDKSDRIRPPKGLSRAESKQFREICAQLTALETDPKPRRTLISDIVHAESRIARLREQERDDPSLAASRALNVATAERRRLHAAVFERPKALGISEELTPEQRATVEAHREADAAYRAFDAEWEGRERTAEYKTAECAMDERHGPWPWSVLCYPAFDDAVAEGWSVGLPIPEEYLDRTIRIRNRSRRA